jgi:hypothetical protein
VCLFKLHAVLICGLLERLVVGYRIFGILFSANRPAASLKVLTDLDLSGYTASHLFGVIYILVSLFSILVRSMKPKNRAVIERAALTLLNLREGWEWATREERKMLVRTMIQEAGCDVGTKRIVWVKVNPDYEILFQFMDRLRPDAGRRYWIREQGTEGNIVGIGEEMEQVVTEIKTPSRCPTISWQSPRSTYNDG